MRNRVRPILGNECYACHLCSHSGHFVGFLSATRAISPIGKKQHATIICHNLKPPLVASELHFGHDNCDAILSIPPC